MDETTYRARIYTVPAVLDSDTLRIVARLAGGYTVTPGTGGWVDDSGRLVEEPSATLEVIGNDPAVYTVVTFVAHQARAKDESAVLVTIEAVPSLMLDVSHGGDAIGRRVSQYMAEVTP
jgi:hypothetical protein